MSLAAFNDSELLCFGGFEPALEVNSMLHSLDTKRLMWHKPHLLGTVLLSSPPSTFSRISPSLSPPFSPPTLSQLCTSPPLTFASASTFRNLTTMLYRFLDRVVMQRSLSSTPPIRGLFSQYLLAGPVTAHCTHSSPPTSLLRCLCELIYRSDIDLAELEAASSEIEFVSFVNQELFSDLIIDFPSSMATSSSTSSSSVGMMPSIFGHSIILCARSSELKFLIENSPQPIEGSGGKRKIQIRDCSSELFFILVTPSRNCIMFHMACT